MTTPFGNEGIRAVPGAGPFAVGTASEFTRAVIALLKDPALRAATAERGRMHPGTSFAPEGVARTLDEEYRDPLRIRDGARA